MKISEDGNRAYEGFHPAGGINLVFDKAENMIKEGFTEQFLWVPMPGEMVLGMKKPAQQSQDTPQADVFPSKAPAKKKTKTAKKS